MPDPTAMTTPALHRLLDANLQLAPEYRDQLTNHLPMALQALHAMGAGPARLESFFATYARRFDGRPTLPPVAAVDWRGWRQLRERADAFAALQSAFGVALAHEGRDRLLRSLLPQLLPGLAAAAFHGAIRTAHAVESGHAGELAAALAYWAWRWQALAPPPKGAPMAFDDWAARLVSAAPSWTTDGPLISLRMAAATSSPPYQALAGRLAIRPDLLPRLAAIAAARYADSGNFTVLHMVTGLRALRVLLPWIGDLESTAPLVVAAFTAAYLAARVPAAPRPAPRPLAWPDAIAAACASDDDHVVKLVHASREEAAVYGEGRYAEAAARALS